MVKVRDVVAGALALEFGDVVLVALGIAAVGVTLYLIEQHAEDQLNAGVNSVVSAVTYPFTVVGSWGQYLFGTGDTSDTGL